MDAIFDMFFGFFRSLFDTLNTAELVIGGYSVNFGWLMLSFVVISIVATVFWKGAKG